jgi:signal transduction histidine kinase/ActR/RegA family two-component response regulator
MQTPDALPTPNPLAAPLAAAEARIRQLEQQMAAQQKTLRVLMDRVEHSIDDTGNAYALFERNITLQKLIEARTTELEQANARLQHSIEHATRAQEAAEAANHSKSVFLANMSHELRTPMNAIIGLAHMLARNTQDPQQRNRIVEISHAADHLLHLLNDVLDLSKMDAQRMVLEQGAFTIGGVFRNLESICRHRAEHKGLNLGFELDNPLYLQPLLGDALRLQQVLLNLLGNAIKFTESGVVSVSARITGETADAIALQFAVSDSGIGILPDALQRIFAPFEQADGSTTRQYGGSGLGLTISQRFVELMGGTIEVRSDPGTGSCFSFSLALPKVDHLDELEIANEAGLAAERQLRQRRGTTRILVAEDDAINQEVMRELLVEALGFEVDLADNGLHAVQQAGSTSYDLILMDMQMPEIDGASATRQIRQLPNGGLVPIVAVTANAFVEDRQHCLAAGMNDFLTKPLNPDQLFVTLQRWLPAEHCQSAAFQTV